jgi:multisubunit Na+/H+ antiporter MnhC subunit
LIEANPTAFVVLLAVIAATTATIQLNLFGRNAGLGNWFVSVSLSTILTGALGVVLVRFGALTSFPLAASGAVLLSILAAFFRQDPSIKARKLDLARAPEGWLVVCLFLVSLVFFLPFPTYFLNGARDHGVYIIQAIVIGRTGGMDFDLPFLGQISETLRQLVKLSYPGFYNLSELGRSTDPTTITPQFRPLSPVLFAMGSWAWGLEGIVRVNGIVSSLCVVLLYVVARQYMPVRFAVAAAVGLLINASFLWVGRATFTEPFIVLVGLSVIALLTLADRRSHAVAIFTGVIAGVAAFNRWDGVLTGFFLAGYLVYTAVWQREKLAFARSAILTFIIVAGFGYAEGALFSTPQMLDMLDQVFILLAILVALAFLAIATPAAMSFMEKAGIDTPQLARRSVSAVALFVVILIIYRVFTGFLPNAAPAERAVVEIAWYLTYPVIALVPATLLLVNRQRDVPAEFVFLIGLPASLIFAIFAIDPRIYADHFWASRRWLSYCIPLSVLCASYCLAQTHDYFAAFRKWIPGAILATVCGLYVVQNAKLTQAFALTPLYKKTPADFDALANSIRQIGKTNVVLVEGYEGEYISSVLTYVYGIKSLNLIDDWQPQASFLTELENVVLVGHFSDAKGFNRPKRIVPLCAQYTEQVHGRRPLYLSSTCKRIRLTHPGLVDSLPTVESGKSIDVSSLTGGSDPLDIGWHHIEGWGSWLEGGYGTLRFLLPSGGSGQCRLRIAGQAFLDPRFSSFSVATQVNGQKPLVFEAKLPDRSFSWEIPFDVLPNGDREVLVEIRPKESSSAFELSLSLDRRQLSIGLQSLEFLGCRGSG